MSMTPFLALPAEVQHIIDEDSPLYGLTQADLARLKAEIAFVFEGENSLSVHWLAICLMSIAEC